MHCLALEISAAFDAVSHAILCKRVESDFGVTGVALNWLKSFCAGSFAVRWCWVGEARDVYTIIGCPVRKRPRTVVICNVCVGSGCCYSTKYSFIQ